jgi:cytochrome P450
LPFIIFSILKARGNFAEAVRRMLRDYKRKTLFLKVGWKSLVISVDPGFARSVLVDHAQDFPKARWEKRVLKPVMEGGLIILEGNDWKEHRTAVAPCFSASLMDELGTIVVGAARDRISKWQRRIQVGPEMRCITSDVLARFFLRGHRISDRGNGALDHYARTYARLEEGLEDRVFDPTGLVGALKAGVHNQPRFSMSLNLVNRIINEQVSRAAAQPSPRKTALEMMLGQLTEQAVCQEIRTLTAAGATTVHLLTWACQLLGTHPNIQRRLRCEIPSITEQGKWVSTLERCGYLAAVIQEALRLYPPAPYLLRQGSPTFNAGSDPDLPPPSSLVLISLWGMHRDPDFFGSPEEFIPERWLGTSGRGIESNEAFLGFGIGPRVCIGKRFAMIEAMVILAEIVRAFEILPVRRRPVAPKLAILTRPKKDVVMSVEPVRQDLALDGSIYG